MADWRRSVRRRFVHNSRGGFVGLLWRVEAERMRGVHSEDIKVRIGHGLPVALRLRDGSVYVGSAAAHTHAELWQELAANETVPADEVADLGFWLDGTYYASRASG